MATLNEYESMLDRYRADRPYENTGTQYSVQDLVSGARDDLGTYNQIAYTNDMRLGRDWMGTLTPEQRGEYTKLYDARHAEIQAKMKRNRMIALGAVAAVGGAGALTMMGGAGGAAGAGLGGLDAGSVFGAGSGWGMDTLGAMGLGADSLAATGLGATAIPLGESALPVFTDIGAEALSGLGSGGGLSGLGGGGVTSSVPGLDGYYSGLGGVDGSLIGGGVNNPGFASWYQSIPKGTLSKLVDIFGGADSLIKGLYSLYQSNKFSDLGKGTPSQQTANAQLDALLKDPSQIYKMPGWEAGLQAVERTGAGQGYLGSGNMMIALNKYGGDFYNNTVRQLNDIATGGQSIQAGYNVGAANLFGQGANSLGYWMSKFGKPVFDMIGG